MMRIAVILGLALAAGATHAQRTLELIEGAHELVLGDVILPDSSSGLAVFKLCASCEPKGLQVASSTRYLINDRELDLGAFLEAVELVRDSDGGDATGVGLYYDLKTNRVTRIVVLAR
jgi:hypothetical protein